MGDKISLKIEPRSLFGKKVKQLRSQGLVPGVVYGAGMEPVAFQIQASELRRAIAEAGKHTPINLSGATKKIALIKDITYNPTKAGVVRHVSLHAVRADEPVVAEVPVRLLGLGESEAERVGLVILQAVDRIEVRALPMELPESIEIDVTELAEHGDNVKLADAKLPQGVEFVERETGREDDEEDRQTIADLVVANVYEPSALAAANDAAAGDADSESEVAVDGEDEAEAGEADSSEADKGDS